MAVELALDKDALGKFGQTMKSLFDAYALDRRAAEDGWLQKLRQFRGIYDPEIRKAIPADRSKAYPKLTRWKVIGTVARLMQMLFPQTEKNYGVKCSPIPNLPTEQLQEVLDKLTADKLTALQAENPQATPADVTCTDEEIELAIREYAAGKAERMETKLDDQLQEMEYITLARKVVFSATLYNVGVLKGPQHLPYTKRTWEKDPQTGRYKAVEVTKLKPRFEFRSVWGWYPDMNAQSLDRQHGEFERHVMIRREVEELAERADFMKDQVNDWLTKHSTGNHVPLHWETELEGENKSDRKTASKTAGTKYVVISYTGDVLGKDLKIAGVDIKEADLHKSHYASVWMIDNTIIKAKLALLGDGVRQFHPFVFEDDDLSLLGNGLCDTLRDSQLSIAEAARMLLDEASLGGENLEVNMDLLANGQDTTIGSYKVWRREGQGAEATVPAVRPITRGNRLAELNAIVQMFLEFANNESGLPPPSLGDVSAGSEALRTQQNASMFLGAAALPIRDTVRNFDTFTISAMTALLKWNAKYDPDATRDGDFDIIARGSTSLIAKEVLAQSLDAFSATLTDEERAHIKTRKLLEARAKARDIPTQDLMETEQVAAQKLAEMRAAQQKLSDLQASDLTASIQQKLADAFKKVAEAKKADASVTVDVVELILEALSGGNGKGSSARAGAGATSA